ncbi:MAG: hypothetical protein WBA43_13990 [Elainellaceae cyanobacterium]
MSALQNSKPGFFAKTRQFYKQTPLPETFGFYSYPIFVYLVHCQQTEEDKNRYSALLKKLPAIFEEHTDHFPLLSRAWYRFKDVVEPKVLEQSVEVILVALCQEEGLPYPELPWWKSIFTLDSLMLLKKWSYL